MNQIANIISYIDTHGSITQLEALRFFGCGRLASRICEMKKAGFDIRKETVKVRNLDGTSSHVARYSWGVKE